MKATKDQLQYKIVDLLNDYLERGERFDLDDHVDDLLALLDLPKELLRSDAYNEDPLMAWRYWCQGFRAGQVGDLKSGDEVLYKSTDVFRLGVIGDFKVGHVLTIEPTDEGYAFLVQLAGESDPTYVEPDDEIWYRHGN